MCNCQTVAYKDGPVESIPFNLPTYQSGGIKAVESPRQSVRLNEFVSSLTREVREINSRLESVTYNLTGQATPPLVSLDKAMDTNKPVQSLTELKYKLEILMETLQSTKGLVSELESL